MTLETDKKKRKTKNWRISKEAADPERYFVPGFALVEKIFWLYPHIKAKVEEHYNAGSSYYRSGSRDNGGSSNRAFISDPTYQLVEKRLSRTPNFEIPSEDFTVKRPDDWLAVIEQTLKQFDSSTLVGGVLRKRYIANEPMASTCIRYELTYSKYYRLRDAGINYARECAIQLGLIKIFDRNENK